MRREKYISGIFSIAFGFLLSFSAVSAVITAFSMEVSLIHLAQVCLLVSLGATLCYSLPLGLVPAGGFAAVLGYLWHKGSLELSVEALLYRISKQYHQGYGWPIIRWTGRVAEEMELTLELVLCLIGAGLALLVCYSITRRKTAGPALLGVFCTVACCFVVTDTVPDTVYLYLLLTLGMVLLLWEFPRQHSGVSGNRFLAMGLPAVALAVLLLFAAVPRQSYTTDGADRLYRWIMESKPVQTLLGKTAQNDTVQAEIVDLSQVGYRTENQIAFLQIQADFEGTVYLRGRARDYYDGVSWQDSELAYTNALQWPKNLESRGVAIISTRFAHNILYVPYYVTSSNVQSSTYANNEQKLAEYSFGVLEQPSQTALARYQADSSSLSGYMGQFISQPDTVKSWALPLAQRLTGDTGSVYQKAERICSYVRASATYDTQTPRMPQGEKDFARWFLEDSDIGYCVHFATATTVLLQAAGVPARYVTGYTVQVQKDKAITVTGENAHAWCEYWLPGYGWTVLEATPPAMRPAATEPTAALGETEAADSPQTPTAQELPPKTEATEQSHTLLYVVLGLLLAGVLLWVQYTLRRALRRRRFAKAKGNRQALVLWRYAVQLAGLLQVEPEAALLELAQKAKFSNHTLTEQELEEFWQCVAGYTTRLKERNFFLQLYYRLILAIY